MEIIIIIILEWLHHEFQYCLRIGKYLHGMGAEFEYCFFFLFFLSLELSKIGYYFFPIKSWNWTMGKRKKKNSLKLANYTGAFVMYPDLKNNI